MASKISNSYRPDYVSHPGITLLDVLNDRGMSQAELSRRSGRPKKTINEIIQGKSAISSITALQFEKVLGIPSEFWLDRQRHYDESLARLEERNQLEKLSGWLDKFSLNNMIKMGWINQFENKIDQTIELLSFFGVASPDQWDVITQDTVAAFKLAKTYESSIEDLTAWLRMGEILAQKIYCEPYNESKFIYHLNNEIRDLTVTPPEVFQSKLRDICSSVGVAVVFVPQLPNAKVCGATRWLSPEKALIQLSLRYKTDDHLWFTFYHEAAHIVIHGKRDIYLETSKNKLETKEKEDQADKFAADILIPPDELELFLESIPSGRYPSKNQIAQFSNQIGIAPSIIVGRLQHDRLPTDNPLPYTHFHDLKKRFVWAIEN